MVEWSISDYSLAKNIAVREAISTILNVVLTFNSMLVETAAIRLIKLLKSQSLARDNSVRDNVFFILKKVLKFNRNCAKSVAHKLSDMILGEDISIDHVVCFVHKAFQDDDPDMNLMARETLDLLARKVNTNAGMKEERRAIKNSTAFFTRLSERVPEEF